MCDTVVIEFVGLAIYCIPVKPRLMRCDAVKGYPSTFDKQIYGGL